MRVRVLEACRTYYNYEVHDLAKDAEYTGEFAKYLASSGSPIEVLEQDPEPEPAAEQPPAPPETGGDQPAAGDGPSAPEGLDIEGTVDTVLTWVGDDPDRARQALTLEQAKGDKARVTLLKRLEVLADPDQ